MGAKKQAVSEALVEVGGQIDASLGTARQLRDQIITALSFETDLSLSELDLMPAVHALNRLLAVSAEMRRLLRRRATLDAQAGG